MNNILFENQLLKFFFVIITFLVILLYQNPVFSQDDDNPFENVKEYMQKRMYPNDTLWRFGYSNAIQQKNSLIQNSGFLYPTTNSSWVSRGPTPGQFSGYGYISGRAEFVKVDPDYSNIIYLGGSDGGVWKSENYGDSWDCLTPFIECNASGAFAIDRTKNPRTLYYGTGQKVHYEYQFFGLGLFKSTDGGSQWTWIHGQSAGLPELTYFYQIVIDPNNPDHLLAALGQQLQYPYSNSEQPGLYMSTNGGLQWECLVPNLVCTDVAFSPNTNMAYCVGPHAVSPDTWDQGTEYRISTDGGYTFGPPRNDIFQCVGRTEISICQNQPNFIYVITQLNHISPYNKIYKSTDYGFSFTACPNYPFPGYGGSDMWYGYYLSLAVNPEDPQNYYVGLSNLFKTTDGGNTYTQIGGYNTSVHPDFQDIAIDPQHGNYLYTVSDGGAWRSINGGTTMVNLNYSLNLTQFNQMAVNPYNDDIVFGAAQDNGCQRSNSVGSNLWTYIAGGDFGNLCFQKVTPGNFVGANSYGGVISVSFNGLTFQYGSNGIPGFPGTSRPVISHPNEPLTFFAGVTDVYKSTDGGLHWNAPYSFQSGMLLSSVAVCSINPNIMYAVQEYNYDPSPLPDIWKTTNGGQSWETKNVHNYGIPNRIMTNICFDPSNPDEAIVSLSGFRDVSNPNDGNIFKTTDGGSSWVPASGDPNNIGLPNNPVNYVLIYYSDCNTKTYVAATDLGIFSSVNGGSTWQSIADGLPTVPCMQLDYSRLNQKLYACTYGRGVWELDLGGGLAYDKSIYVKDKLAIGGDINMNYDIIVCSGGTLSFPSACTIQFANGKGITVQDGGNLLATTGNQINFTSQSGLWGGIEFKKGSIGILKYCQFSNSEIPVAANFLDGGMDNLGGSGVTVDHCTFNNGTMTIAGNGSIAVSYNIFNGASTTYNEAIFIHNCDGAGIVENNILNAPIGIGISSAGVALTRNHVLNSQNNGNTGISIDNCYSFIAKDNEVKGYTTGIFLYNSSPSLFSNNCYNISDTALSTIYNSNPLMHPTDDGSGTLTWVGGQDTLTSSKIGINFNNSYPDINSGYNFINATNAYLYGSAATVKPYSAYNNCWDWGSPNTNKFQLNVSVRWNPYNCIPPGAYNTLPGNENLPINIFNGLAGSSTGENESELDPPNPIIIDLGNGFYDTIKVTTGTINLTGDKLLLSQGVNQQLLGNYSNAISNYQNVVQNYHDSSSSLNALGRILICNDKMHVDTNSYTNLRNYYLTVAQNYPSDTLLRKVAVELANKTLVRKNQFADAITAYENVVQNSNDNLEILCSELNIIETYMIMNSNTNGNSVSFTGKIQSLKPKNFKDGIVMINELLHHIKPSVKENVIPKEFKLSQNYPNPFNPTTKIDYQLPKSAKVVIKVYDILGKLVKELVNEQKDAGYFTVTFNGSNFASGVYFYRINAGEFNAVKKMVLIK